MAIWERLSVVDMGDVLRVVPDDDPEDWVVSFAKSPGFPAHDWAERMTTLYNRRPTWSKFRTEPVPPAIGEERFDRFGEE